MSNSERIEKNKKFYLKSGILSIVGYVFNKSISFLMIPILTKIMTTADYGIVNTYLAWVSILSYIIGLALEYSIRTAYTDYKDNYESYISATYLLSLITFLCIGTVVFMLNKFVLHQSNDFICVLCVVHAYIISLINYISVKYTMQEKIAKKVSILLFPNLISAILSIILILNFADDKYMGRILGCVIVFVPVGIFVIISQFFEASPQINKGIIKYSLMVSIPMVFHGLGHIVLSSSDRLIIKHFHGDELTGIYSLVYNFVQVVVAINAAIESVWIPWFTQQMEKNRTEVVNRLGSWYAILMSVLVSCLVLAAPELIIIVSTNDYLQGKEIVLPLLLSSYAIFLYSFPINIEIFYKKTKWIALLTAIAAALNFILDWLLVPKYGMMAAAYVTLVSYVVLLILHYVMSRKLTREVFLLKMYVIPTLIVLIASVLFVVFKEYGFLRWSISVLLGVISIVGFVYLYKNSMSQKSNNT